MLTVELPREPQAVAPDGSDVRILVATGAAGLAHFTLAPHQIAVAVAHRTLEEMWYFVGGEGEMWRRCERTGREETVAVRPGVAITIPSHTRFQFRAVGDEPLCAVGVTLPPWPGVGELDGRGECYVVDGPWTPTVASGMGA